MRKAQELRGLGVDLRVRLVVPGQLSRKHDIPRQSRVLGHVGQHLVINYEVLPQGINAGIARSNVQGQYKIVLPYGKQYGFLAEAKSFASVSNNIDLTNVESYREINRDLFLVPLEVGETVRMNNIFFAFWNFSNDFY